MKLVTFSDGRGEGIGALHSSAKKIIDFRDVPGLPSSMIEFISAGPSAIEIANGAIDAPTSLIDIDNVEIIAPIPRPARNIFCIGKNYRTHIDEMHESGWDKSLKSPDAPGHLVVFTKSPRSVIGPETEIPRYLDPEDSVDYEAEIAVVIGEGGRGISAESAEKHIFGYTLFNDVSARALQMRHEQWFMGKSIDGFGPMGPYLVTPDEIEDVDALRIVLSVNGEIRQDAIVAHMIFDIPTIIETLSRTMTLYPGDVIATGTPDGVGMGFKPPRFLRKGDRIEITAGPLGTLGNTVA